MLQKENAIQIRSRSGIAALVTMLTIALFLVSVGFLVAQLSGAAISRGALDSQATKAQFIADTGVQDALIKLARDSQYEGSYSISDPAWSVDVSVTSGTSAIIIIATSTVSGGGIDVQRTIRADVTLDADGQIIDVTKQNY